MTDARFDRPATGDAVGDATPACGSTRVGGAREHDVVPARDWTRRTRARSKTPLLMHWIDEKGSVVRLMSSSTGPEADAGGP